MYTSSDDRRAQIVDLNEGRMYDLDLRDKTYEVTTFKELRARMEELRERAPIGRESSSCGGWPAESRGRD
jgi:hypothetical protein